jgi:acetyl-CoA carboxylase biotin carboxyl carrier protein
MAGSPSNQDYFDLRKIRRLVELMNEHDLTEIDLRQGDVRIQLRRGGEPCVAPPMVRMPAALPQESRSSEAATEAAPQAGDEHIVAIKSPMVGTFYSSPDPDSPPYVRWAITSAPTRSLASSRR